MLSFNFSPYVLPEHKDNLLKYKYVGEDRSFIYGYFWRPLCARTVKLLPPWLAPNTITVAGLAGVSLMHLVILYYMPNLTIDDPRVEPPAVIFILSALFLFLYQFLDNLDGHQARRTGASSPLGLLMDHGCDAFNCVVGSLSVAACVSTGPTWKTWVTLVNAVVVFFCNTWEEYYRGALILPVINGPNEGILCAISIYLVTAFFGGSFWLQSFVVPTSSFPIVGPLLHDLYFTEDSALGSFVRDTVAQRTPPMLQSLLTFEFPFVTSLGLDLSWFQQIYDPSHAFAQILSTLRGNMVPMTGDGTSSAVGVTIQFNTLAVLFMSILGVVTIAGNFYQVWLAVSRHPTGHGKYGHGWFVNRFPFIHALSRLLPLFLVTVMANIWFMHSPQKIFAAHPRLFCWTVGLLYTKLAIHLMISHLCSREFHPFRRTLIPFLYLGLHISVTRFLHAQQQRGDGDSTNQQRENEELLANEEVFLYEFFALSCVTFLHLAYNAPVEMARILDIDVFSSYKQRQRAAAAAAANSAKKAT